MGAWRRFAKKTCRCQETRMGRKNQIRLGNENRQGEVMLFEITKWGLAAASLVGVVANIKHKRWCFGVWAVTNAAWTGVDIYHEVWAQAALQAIYFGLAIWGLIAWKKS